jgi:hypothetical protein
MCHMYMYKNFSAHLITGDNLWFSSNPAACTSADVWHGHPSHISWGQKHPCPQNSPSQLITTHVHSSPPHWLPSHLPYFFICLIPFSHPLENPKACTSPSPPPKFQPLPPLRQSRAASSTSSLLRSSGHRRSRRLLSCNIGYVASVITVLFFARFHFPHLVLDWFPSRIGSIWSACSCFLGLFFSSWIFCRFVPISWWTFLVPNRIDFFWCSPASTSCGRFITQMRKSPPFPTWVLPVLRLITLVRFGLSMSQRKICSSYMH